MKVAAVQMDVFFGKVEANVAKVLRHLGNLTKVQAELVVFPEAALTGYCFDSLEAALGVAIDVSGPSPIDEIEKYCKESKIAAVVGFAEKSGKVLYNSLVFFDPGQERRIYRKCHLPFLGMDRFACPGEELPVWETSIGRIGPLICFDLRPPEATRTLALKGAQVIVLPTNWPEGAETSAEHIAIARAAENRVFLVTCNRVGTENGFRFIGKSKIVHCSGRVLAAGEAFEVVLIADIQLDEADTKHVINIPGEYEIDLFSSRRCNIYSLNPS